ncbi:MAG: TadE/TadG family type IV pilus assembly protein [Sagittula sp.]|uniref:TadE/TadG family type IV pilus assembly protein n=1 Tax=Sagittula sp. TaxID=2038081 RepID=UPI004058E3A4
MFRPQFSFLRRFRAGDDGSMVVPIALWMPIFLLLIISSIELGTITVRSTVLERALDQTVRDVKLGTGPNTHAQMKEAICNRAQILPSCMETLHLEMVVLDVRDWTDPPEGVDCYDNSLPVTPQRNFQNGKGGEMMFLRACYKFKPLTLISSFNAALPKDDAGYVGLVAMNAFVNEPS